MASLGARGQITFEYANYWASEGELSVQIAVIRNGPATVPVSVTYGTTNGTAKAGADYSPGSGTLDFAAEERLKLFTVPITNNGDKNANRTFTVGLGKPTGDVSLGSPRLASIAIIDNDPGVQFQQNRLWVRQSEGSVMLTVTRGNDIHLDAFSVDYTTTNGTAAAGIDYVAVSGTLAFTAGEMTRSFTVPVLRTELASRDRQFKVLLGPPTGAASLGAAAGTVAVVTILDTREMEPHHIEVSRGQSGLVGALNLTGGYSPGLGASTRFSADFDIIPVEVSTNLTEWMPLTWLVRSNASTAPLTWVDPELLAGGSRFYRTPAATFIAPQRPPQGPYPVGFTDRIVGDDTRRNRYRISTNGTFPLTVWYPARRIPGRWPDESYHPEVLARDPRPGAWEGEVDRAAHWKRYAMNNAPFAEGLGRVPVVVWSSGYLYARFDAQEWAEHLASHGYVVVAADHLDSSVVVYPDGRYIYLHYDDTIGRAVDLRLLQDRVRDCGLILDQLTQWDDTDPLFGGKLDVQNAAAMGWSLGGGTAVEFCRVDPRVKAAISLDGAYLNLGTLLSTGVPKPVLAMSQVGNSELSLFGALTGPGVFFEIHNAVHDSFSTYYWDLKPAPPDRGRETARTIVDYSLWFVNRHLKGSSDAFPPVANYRQVANLRQK